MLWDDIGFFGYIEHKLARLKGINPRWFDRFKNPTWLFKSFLLVSVFVYILSVQFPNLNTIKTQSIIQEEKENYEFKITEYMKILSK